MTVKRKHRLPAIALGLLIVLCASGAQAAPLNSTWICEGGNYCTDLKCWNPLLGVPPCNTGPLAFNVTIPAGNGTISVDCDCQVSDFTLAGGRTFKVIGHKTYAVAGQANISGVIYGNGGNFIAPKVAFVGCAAQAFVDNGATVEIGAPTYCATGLNAGWSNYTLLSSEGAGSLLKLSGMTELDDGVSITGGAYSHTIVAQSGGRIDLSGLKRVTGPSGDEILNINVNPGGQIKLDSLTTVSHGGGSGRVSFNVDGNAALRLPSLTSVSSAEFHVTKGAVLEAGNPSWAYSTTGLNAGWSNYTLLSSEGAGSLLKLSGMTELDDGVSITGGAYSHTIVAQNGGGIDLSGLKKIIGATSDETSSFRAAGGTIDMSSLQTIVGNVSFSTDDGGELILGNANAAKATTVTLNDGNDLVVASNDLNLGTTLIFSNPGKGSLALYGDFAYAHTDETKVPFDQSYVFFSGEGPQELEAGGLDVMTVVGALPKDKDGHTGNFGFGQMIVGEPNNPTAVFLVDRVDNENRHGFGGDIEALYLFGKDGQNGLRILDKSTLYMGGLHVYAMLNGVVTDLTTLFKPNETMISFDKGYLCLYGPDVNDPCNLIKNGGFETGKNPPTAANPIVVLAKDSTDKDSTDRDYWDVVQGTINWTYGTPANPAAEGMRFVDLSSGQPGKGAVSQVIQTEPNVLYQVWFDLAANPAGTGKRILHVSAAASSEEFSATYAGWQKKTWHFRATEKTTTLTFAGLDDADTPFSVQIDNVIVLPSTGAICSRPDLTVEVTDIDTSSCPVVRATVIVTDPNGKTPDGLHVASSFSVSEDGHVRSPITVRPSGAAISVSLVLDCSGSMGSEQDPRSALTKLKGAAKAFVDCLRPEQDLAEIIKFATFVEVMQGFVVRQDHEPDPLKLAIDASMMIEDKTRQTALYNAVYDAISHTDKQPYNRAVVAMSDGEDTVSSRTVDQVIAQARALGVPVYTIGLCTDTNDAPCTLTDKGERALKRMADETGGLYIKVTDPNQLKGIYEKIAGMLKNQYLVTYDSVACLADNAAASEHVLEIQVVAGAAQGRGTKTFNCPTACKP